MLRLTSTQNAKEKWFSFAGLPRAVAGFNNFIIGRISDNAVNILCISDDLSTCLLDCLLKQPLKPKMFLSFAEIRIYRYQTAFQWIFR